MTVLTQKEAKEPASQQTQVHDPVGAAERDAPCPLEALNRRYAVVQEGGKLWVALFRKDPNNDRDDFVLMNRGDFIASLEHQRVGEGDKSRSVAEQWLRWPGRRQYEGILFGPSGVPDGYLNTFQGLAFEPQPGDWGLMREHVEQNICGGVEDLSGYVLKWMAHAVQRPWELPGVALLVKGRPGTGKNVFAEHFGALFGPHFRTFNGLRGVADRFNSGLETTIVALANEVGSDLSQATAAAVKPLVTDQVLSVEQKFHDRREVRNYLRLILASNSEAPLRLDPDDRRFLVLPVGDHRREDHGFFEQLARQMVQGGYQAMAHDLSKMDLGGFDPRRLPASAAAFDVKLRTAEPLLKWCYEVLCDGANHRRPGDQHPWQNTLPKREVYEGYRLWRQRSGHGGTPEIQEVFGKDLMAILGPAGLRESRCKSQKHDPATGELEPEAKRHCYVFPDLGLCREAFQDHVKACSEIWPAED